MNHLFKSTFSTRGFLGKSFYTTANRDSLNLKSRPYLIPTLKITKTQTNQELDLQLKNKILLSPGFYKNAAVVLDISDFERIDILQISDLFKVCESNDLLPVGISSESTSQEIQELIKNVKMPIIPSKSISTSPITNNNNNNNINSNINTTTIGNNNNNNSNVNYAYSSNNISTISENQSNIQQTSTPPLFSNSSKSNNSNNTTIPPISTLLNNKIPPMIINGSLRSGQQAYSQNGADLIVMGNVHSGAEAISDNNIYIFGTLKGRANAGVTGNKNSKIIVNKFQAELISIASIYHACEVQPRLNNPKNPTTIQLSQDDKLIFTSSD